MTRTPSLIPLGVTFNMSDPSRNATLLIKQLFGKSETDNMVAAGTMRMILADITKLYFDHKGVRGKGILVFNPEEPDKSRYLTITDLEADIAVAQEVMNKEAEELFQRVVKIIEKEHESDLALIAMIHDAGVAIHLLDAEECNKKIDEYANGLII